MIGSWQSMRRSLLAFLIVLLAAEAWAGEMRGLWVVRTALVSPQAVDRVVDQAALGGFNTLFVQVRGRGDAFYDSRMVPRSPVLWRQPASFDPLKRLLARARARGLEVHGWVNVLLAAHLPLAVASDHVLARHPDWAMVPKVAARQALAGPPSRLLSLIRAKSRALGDVEGFYLSPSAAGVHRHLEAVVRELLESYELEGLHLDFIRYPGPSFDYSRGALEAFRRHRGSAAKDLLQGVAEAPEGWAAYRRDILTVLVDRLARAARGARGGVALSAAVVPDEAQALHHKFQSWPQWVANGILDAVCPMLYTEDPRLFRRQLERARARAGRRAWAGVGAYRLPVDATIERIRVARRAGVGGVLVFSHASLSPEGYARLRREAFSTPAGTVELRLGGKPAS